MIIMILSQVFDGRHDVLFRLRADAAPAAHPRRRQVLRRLRDTGTLLFHYFITSFVREVLNIVPTKSCVERIVVKRNIVRNSVMAKQGHSRALQAYK